MFQSARLKLTAWYVLITMLVSITFSLAFYRASTFEIQRIIDRIHYLQQQSNQLQLPTPPNAIITLDQLQDVKTRLQVSLVVINGIIFLLSGGAGYFLAGRTLRPIKNMMDEQNQFISDASHELRTPIATLRAEMEAALLEKHVGVRQARNVIESNLEELGKLQELANNLLELAYVHGKDVKFSEIVTISDVVHSAHKKIAPIAKKKQIDFKFGSITGKVKGNKQNLMEVFVNLFDNAVKYSHAKSTVSVYTKGRKNIVEIVIADQGIGIAQDDLEHIFDRFYRADKSRSQADGHGLGLSIAKKIITAHSGFIEVESTLKKGTTFTITLPIVA